MWTWRWRLTESMSSEWYRNFHEEIRSSSILWRIIDQRQLSFQYNHYAPYYGVAFSTTTDTTLPDLEIQVLRMLHGFCSRSLCNLICILPKFWMQTFQSTSCNVFFFSPFPIHDHFLSLDKCIIPFPQWEEKHLVWKEAYLILVWESVLFWIKFSATSWVGFPLLGTLGIWTGPQPLCDL